MEVQNGVNNVNIFHVAHNVRFLLCPTTHILSDKVYIHDKNSGIFLSKAAMLRECPFAMWWLNIWFEIMNRGGTQEFELRSIKFKKYI